MSRKLPAISIDLLNGRAEAISLAEHCQLAYWLHGREDATAQYMLDMIHADFAALADALGYDITERQPAAEPVEVAA